VRMSCVELAAALSLAYRTYEPFNVSDISINDYLSTNGVLLTVCAGLYGNKCRILEDTVSASWVQEKTGFRTIRDVNSTILDLNVGYILDPKQADIHCLYPLDAITRWREEPCGKIDPFPGWRHQTLKTRLELLKRDRYPHTPWESIPCREILGLKRRSAYLDYANGLNFYSEWISLAHNYEIILKHPVCNTSDLPPVDWSHPLPVFYYQDVSWNVTEWQDVMNIQSSVINQHPNAIVWNEVVLSKPASIPDMVQAVFYVGEDPEDAIEEAQRLDKPLLQVNAHQSDTFSCFQQDASSQAEDS